MQRLAILYLILATAACKHVGPTETKLSQVYNDKAIDTLVLSKDLVSARSECQYHSLNFLNNALAEGLIRNGAVQGLGTDNPAGKKLRGESLYFQMVRIVSIADWEMLMALGEKKSDCLVEKLSLNFGVLPLDYAASLPEPFPGETDKLRRAAGVVNPALGDFKVLEIDGMETPKAWPSASSFPPDYQKALYEGVMEKVRFASRAIGGQPSLSALDKARSLAAAYTPYSVSLNALFPQQKPKGSQYYLEAYLPPFYALSTPDEARVETWKLTPGLKKTPLPKEIDISVARLTHIGYMLDSDHTQTPMIKVQVFKDFNEPNRIKTRFTFGRVDPKGAAKGSIPLDFSNYRDALYISFYPNMAADKKDNAIVKAFKSQFNTIAKGVEVEARIHQLTLNLERQKPGDTLESLYLKPRFSMKDSDISFRLHRAPSDTGEADKMKKVGFTCQPKDGKLDCYQDFGAYTELALFLNNDFKGPADGKLTTKISELFKDLLNRVVKQNVKWVIDWNIETIEKAIDEQFIQIFEDLVEKQDESNEKIRVRLEEALFREKT